MGEATSAVVAGNSMHAGSRSSAVLLVETAILLYLELYGVKFNKYAHTQILPTKCYVLVVNLCPFVCHKSKSYENDCRAPAGVWHIGFLHISYSMSEGIWGRVRDLGTDSLITTTVNLVV